MTDADLSKMRSVLQTSASITEAARVLGVPRQTLQDRIRKHGIEKKPFLVDPPASSRLSIQQLLAQRRDRFAAKRRSKDGRDLVPVDIQIDGPIGIAHFGDPHIDDDGTNIALLEEHLRVVNATEGLFAGNVGDYQNNWVGRLAHLWAQQSTSHSDAWQLTEWLIGAADWLYLVGGNHDAWSGNGDPLEWIAAQQGALMEPRAVRLELRFPGKGGRRMRVNARHDFKGHSMWNTAHGPAKAVQMGWRDHLVVAGHTHVSGYQILKDPASGLISHAIRVASYKQIDRYALENGFPDQQIFMCPVTILDPRFPDNDPRAITTIFDPVEGADFLKWKRAKWARGSGRG